MALWLRFRIEGNLATLALPAFQDVLRHHALWEHTCFEAFLQHQGRAGYFEINVAPSGAFAFYEFDGYRSGMRTFVGIGRPEVDVIRGRDFYQITVSAGLPRPLQSLLGVSAVIEEESGTKSHWALAHPPEGPPDFHHPACFVLELPPAPAS